MRAVKLLARPAGSLLILGLVLGCGSDDAEQADVASFEGQPWVLTSGVDVPQDVAITWPSASFADGTVGGSTGCNHFTASYTVDGDSLELGQIASTLMGCPPPADAIEMAYVAALEQVAGWRAEDDDLVLVGADEDELLRYRPATPEGNWEATGLLTDDAFASPLAGTEITAAFGGDGKLSGSAGCNTYIGSYTTDKGAMELTEPAATRKFCSEPAGAMEQEAAYLALLPTVVSYRVDGSSLELLGADGTRLVSYTRAGAR